MKNFRQYTEEMNPPNQDTEDKNLKSKEKRQQQIKKMVLLKKMQAVRAGAGQDIVAGHEPEGEMVEGSLHKWFSGSKSKDGKPGWVQSDGSPCANEPGETKTPKCYSSAKRASMSKKELRSADARKSRKDPNQQQKSGAAKPTYVSTDKKKMKEDYYRGTGEKVVARTKKYMEKKGEKGAPGLDAMKARQKDHEARRGVKKEENEVDECWKTHKKVGMKKKGGKMVPDCRPKNEEVVTEADKKGKGSGTKDACYHKVKARFKVWPSAYGSGALVKCRKAGAANWGNSSKKEEVEYATEEKKKKNCGCGKDPCITYGKQEDVKEAKSAAWQRKEGKRESGGLNQKGVDSYRAANPGSKLKTAVTTKPSKLKKGSKSASRRKSFCARMGGMKKRLDHLLRLLDDPDSRINKALRKWNCSYEPDGTPIMEEDKAFNTVLAALQKKHGKENIITKKNPMKPQSAADKAKARAHQAKVDAKKMQQQRAKDPSQGRYPKG